MSDRSRQRRSPIFREAEVATPRVALPGTSRRIPLTPAMRAALQGSTGGGIRRAMLVLYGAILFVLIVGGIDVLFQLEAARDTSRWIVLVALAFGGGTMLLFSAVTAYQKGLNEQALRIGSYTRYDGMWRITEMVLQGVTRHTIEVNGIRVDIDPAVIIDLPRLRATTGGTALLVSEAGYLLALWDRSGTLLYGAPEYDLDSDAVVARPDGAALAIPTKRPPTADVGGPLIARLNPLFDSPRAMAAIGAGQLLLAVIVANAWKVPS